MWGFMFGALGLGVAFPCIGFGAPMPRRRPLTFFISYPLREDDTASGNFICFFTLLLNKPLKPLKPL